MGLDKRTHTLNSNIVPEDLSLVINSCVIERRRCGLFEACKPANL